MYPPEAENAHAASRPDRPGQCGGEPDRRAPVGELLPEPDDLARLPVALAQMPVVEGQHRESGLVDRWGEKVWRPAP